MTKKLQQESVCLNCGDTGPVHHHHVVPRSLGGVATVPLCGVCHGKAHGHRGMHTIADLTRRALSAKRARGESTGEALYGWRAGEGGRLVPDATEQAVIARVHRDRASGLSVRSIVAALNAEGIRTRSGGAHNVRSVHVVCHAKEAVQ